MFLPIESFNKFSSSLLKSEETQLIFVPKKMFGSGGLGDEWAQGNEASLWDGADGLGADLKMEAGTEAGGFFGDLSAAEGLDASRATLVLNGGLELAINYVNQSTHRSVALSNEGIDRVISAEMPAILRGMRALEAAGGKMKAAELIKVAAEKMAKGSGEDLSAEAEKMIPAEYRSTKKPDTIKLRVAA